MKIQRLFPLVLALALTACNAIVGSGKNVSESRAVGAFHAVAIHNGMKLKVTVGSPASVKVFGDDNIVPEIQTIVSSNGELSIELKSPMGAFTSDIDVGAEVVVPSLDGLSASGGSTAEARGIDATSFGVNGSGGSEIALDGNVDTLSLDLSGASKLDGTDLATKHATLRMSGASTARMHVTGDIAADLSGASEAKVTGNPSVTAKDLSGGSTLSIE